MVDLTLSDADKARITAAVTAAERASSGEIVTIIAPRASHYHDIAQDWAIIVAFLALAVYASFTTFYLGWAEWALGDYGSAISPQGLLLATFCAVLIKYLGTWLILQSKPLRLWATPKWVKHNRVRAQAMMAFKVTTQQRTAAGTGILIYLSEDERMAEIIAEEGIHAKVGDAVWQDAMAALIANVRQGRVADGMVAAIERVGAVLAQHFPHDPNDINELPDRVIEL
jgi:putative membrane protein